MSRTIPVTTTQPSQFRPLRTLPLERWVFIHTIGGPTAIAYCSEGMDEIKIRRTDHSMVWDADGWMELDTEFNEEVGE